MTKHFVAVSIAALALSACSREAAVAPADINPEDTGINAAPRSVPANILSLLPEQEKGNYAKHEMAFPTFGAVLVSEYSNPDGPPGHVTPGRLDVAYLQGEGEAITVKKRYPKVVEAGSMGSVGEWSISREYLANPVIVTSGGFTGQGMTEGCTVLTELRADGPAEIAQISDYSGNDDSNTEGKIGAIQKGKSFIVTYTGQKTGSVTWTWQGGKFVPSGPAPIESCGEG